MAKQIETQIYQTLDDIVKYLRSSDKKYKLLFAHNGVGKTRLSVSFKDIRKSEGKDRDTLYFNAYTEDLFTWDNDLDRDYYNNLAMTNNEILSARRYLKNNITNYYNFLIVFDKKY